MSEKALLKALEKLNELGGVNKAEIRRALLANLGGERGFADKLYQLTNSDNDNVRARALELIGEYITNDDDNEKKLSTMDTENVFAMAGQILKDNRMHACPHCGGSLVEMTVTKAIGGPDVP